jgi:hypothetical protein
MRGVFVGVILFAVHNYYSYLQLEGKRSFKSFLSLLLPYIPTLLVLGVYFTTYLMRNGWFFHNSNYSTHYSMPNSFGRILKHIAEFGLRSVENGRIVIWLLGMYVGLIMIKSKRTITRNLKTLIALFLSLTGLYVVFIFISQMPFSSRYFMPQFFVLTLITLFGVIEFVDVRKAKLIFIVVLLFELTGNLWIYPDRIAKSWDGTLAHLPFYELRKDCLNYIDEQKIDYQDISAGFCLYGDRRFLDLQQKKQVISSGTNGKYFIYSNISNNEDSFVDSLRNQNYWMPLKRFDKGFISIILYKRK